jgi:uracil DNA glycosylase
MKLQKYMPTDWNKLLEKEFEKPYFQNIEQKIQQDIDD